MELRGKIYKVLPMLTGVSQNGKSWKRGLYVIEIGSGTQYPKKVCFAVFGEDRINNFQISEGEELIVHIDIDAHEFKGTWYNSITAYRVERPEGGKVRPQETYQRPESEPPHVHPTKADDLPF